MLNFLEIGKKKMEMHKYPRFIYFHDGDRPIFKSMNFVIHAKAQN